MKTLGQFLEEAKATYCGRCGTRHVPPSKGGTCPALKEGSIPTADEPTEHDKKMAQKVRDLLAKEKKPVKEEADRGIRTAKVMHKGQHVANVITYRGRGGNWVSGAETPDGENATKKYGIGLIDTKKEILKKIKNYHKENN